MVVFVGGGLVLVLVCWVCLGFFGWEVFGFYLDIAS